MQMFPKTKGFHNKWGLFGEKLTLFNKNYICILRKNFNPGHWVLDKKLMIGKNRPLENCQNSTRGGQYEMF